MRSLPTLFLLFACLAASLPIRASDLNDGYFLLHDICQQEKKVSGILLFKTSPASLSIFLKKVSRVAGETVSALDQMQKDDPALTMDHNPLPPTEQAARKIMEDQRQHQLLFGTKGPDFVRAMLMSQQFASDYTQSLAGALLGQEKDPTRRARLESIRAEWSELKAESFRLLRNVD